MNENLPIKYEKKNILKKLLKFIKSFFENKKNNVKDEGVKLEQESKTKLSEKYKVDGLDEKNEQIIEKNIQRTKMEEIIAIVEKNPDVMESLDISRLEIIDAYYKRKIRECKLKIAKMS